MSSAEKTTDHEEIKRWVEERGGRPARVKGSADDRSGGILRLDFGDPDPSLEEIAWEEFFEIFEESGLALLRQEETESGQTSRFNKLVSRDD